MIFLKKMEIIGFKSFSNKTVINFNKSLVGIVGPNGSGKSNINDAIKWVFGIQSSKYLRSNSSDDIIFSGSATKEQSNYAHVKLLFDNSNRIFSLDYNEVEISCRVFRNNPEKEYYINNTRCKLKDIKMLAKECGLSQSSLSIISQGNISDFAESKPIEKRLFLEDACGVSKYKQYKHESNKKLTASSDNLSRLNDIINEIERRIPKLKKDYEKAIEFKKCDDRLKDIEVKIIVNDINVYENKTKYTNQLLNDLNIQKTSLNSSIDNNNSKLNNYEDKFEQIINNISKINTSYNICVNKITDLKIQKIKLEQNLKYEDKKGMSKKVLIDYNSAKNDIYIEENRLKDIQNIIEKTEKELNFLEERIDVFRKKRKNLNLKINENSAEIFKFNHKISLSSKLFFAVNTILKNKNYLNGILDIVKNVINIDNKYNISFSTILSSNLQNIVVENKQDARDAINFLKSNKSGRATFIPLDVKNPKKINENDLFVLKTIPGFIDIASNLVKYDNRYHNVVMYLLSRHIICNDINSALQIAKLTNYFYTITTLDGSQIKPFGILTGGYKNDVKDNLLSIDKYKEYLLKITEENNLLKKELSSLNSNIEELENNINNKKTIILQNNYLLKNIENNQKILKQKVKNLKQEYNYLNLDTSLNDDKLIHDILNSLQEEILTKDNLQHDLDYLQEEKTTLYGKINLIKQELKFQNTEFNNLNLSINDLEKNNLENSLFLKENLQRLTNSYNMTYDYAKHKFSDLEIRDEVGIRQEIKELKNKLRNIGNVDLSVIEEYKTENERYLKLKSEHDNLNKSVDLISSTIKKMDKIIIEKFTSTIKKINLNLIKTFEKLFNGGKARLIYTDPNDILNTGIDIEVSPPGKKINNINLLSGGEKSLVALSVLFSILESDPLPLVILDEVEAPLDFSNLKGFGNYLSIISSKAQFIVVTHRITTMEYCDTLYGVTMQEEGISKILSVELIDAKNMTNNINPVERVNDLNDNKESIKA